MFVVSGSSGGHLSSGWGPGSEDQETPGAPGAPEASRRLPRRRGARLLRTLKWRGHHGDSTTSSAAEATPAAAAAAAGIPAAAAAAATAVTIQTNTAAAAALPRENVAATAAPPDSSEQHGNEDTEQQQQQQQQDHCVCLSGEEGETKRHPNCSLSDPSFCPSWDFERRGSSAFTIDDRKTPMQPQQQQQSLPHQAAAAAGVSAAAAAGRMPRFRGGILAPADCHNRPGGLPQEVGGPQPPRDAADCNSSSQTQAATAGVAAIQPAAAAAAAAPGGRAAVAAREEDACFIRLTSTESEGKGGVLHGGLCEGPQQQQQQQDQQQQQQQGEDKGSCEFVLGLEGPWHVPLRHIEDRDNSSTTTGGSSGAAIGSQTEEAGSILDNGGPLGGGGGPPPDGDISEETLFSIKSLTPEENRMAYRQHRVQIPSHHICLLTEDGQITQEAAEIYYFFTREMALRCGHYRLLNTCLSSS